MKFSRPISQVKWLTGLDSRVLRRIFRTNRENDRRMENAA
jgi:hypothetical protein